MQKLSIVLILTVIGAILALALLSSAAVGCSCGVWRDNNFPASVQHGVIYSPYFPTDYCNNQYCEYRVEERPGWVTHLELVDFVTEACCDKLYIMESRSDANVSIANLSGCLKSGSKSQCPESGSAVVEWDIHGTVVLQFSSDSSGTNQGFHISFQRSPAEPTTTPTPTTLHPSALHTATQTALAAILGTILLMTTFAGLVVLAYRLSIQRARLSSSAHPPSYGQVRYSGASESDNCGECVSIGEQH